MDLGVVASDYRESLGALPLVRRVPCLIRDAFAARPIRARAQPATVRSAAACAGLAPWQLIRVRRHIEGHLDSRLTNAGLAALLRLNEDHFARAFKASVGRSPHAYVLHCRVELAKSLLSGSTLPVCEIALAAGFADQAHLSRRFRETVGVPPSSWRRLRLGRPQ